MHKKPKVKGEITEVKPNMPEMNKLLQGEKNDLLIMIRFGKSIPT